MMRLFYFSSMGAKKGRLYKDVQYLTTLVPARNSGILTRLREPHITFLTNSKEPALARVFRNGPRNATSIRTSLLHLISGRPKKLIVGAHYDVAGNQPGADDNASGIAGLLEIGRMLSERKPSIPYTVELVAYCLEEPPFFATEHMGSYVHAKSLSEENTQCIGMICLEMTGFFSDEPDSQSYPSLELAKIYPHRANFIVVVGIERFLEFNNKVHALMSEKSGIDVQVISFPTGESLAGLSDHRNYWAFGYNALMINDTSFVRNPNYHTTDDTINTLDFTKMAEVVNCIYRAVINIVE